MKILDLGVCDAGIPLWLHEQAADTITRVDGLDLDRNMIRDARDRAARAGLAGDFVQDNALAAADHFEPGSYDAVVAFELLEHMPRPEDLLEVCKTMARPGGRVYLSTPDGCFGAGSNPHHLHVFRACDLADMVRRRGELQDMVVGSDGVSVCSYIPGAKREDVAIFTGPGWKPWSPMDIEGTGLGGSETAAVRLAAALSELGYVVTVYGDCEQCAFRDVIYRHHSTFDPMERRGALIASRLPEVFDRQVKARRTFLWVHDIDCGDRLTPQRAKRIDHLLALSPWHRTHLGGRYPALKGRIVRTRNGIQRAYFEPKPWEDRDHRVLYTSSPDRGLDVLLELWPSVLEQVPEATLEYAYPDVYDRVAELDPVVAKHRDKVRELADQPGVNNLGSLPQQVLAEAMCSSRVWAHPSWVTLGDAPFHETSCISAMEAQAAGCLVVAADWGALHDTVKIGRLVNSEPLGDRWRDAFVKHIVEGLTDPEVGAWAVAEGPKAAEDLGWAGVAEQLAKLIDA